MLFNKQLLMVIVMLTFTAVSASPAFSAEKGKKTYTEEEFIKSFSGKSRKAITEKLGTPVRKEQAVKPANSSSMVAATGLRGDSKNSKPMNIEMWYYNNIVKYDNKNTYKETELTIVNDKCMNIAFFNSK